MGTFFIEKEWAPHHRMYSESGIPRSGGWTVLWLLILWKITFQKIFCNFSAFEIVQFPIYKVLSLILVILIHNSVDSLMSILLPFNRTEKMETWGIWDLERDGMTGWGGSAFSWAKDPGFLGVLACAGPAVSMSLCNRVGQPSPTHPKTDFSGCTGS